MLVYNNLNEIKHDPNTVLTLGTFDGIHLGHQQILKVLFERSRFYKGRSFLITFHPHPRKVISKDNGLKILSTPAEKAEVLEKMGLDNLFIINFTKDFSQQQPVEFFKNYIINKIGLKEIVVGHDHKFGKGREGTTETLKPLSSEYNFQISKVDEFKIDGEIISSTKIRHAIINGAMETVTSYLGREYSFSGLVIEGDKRGRLLGFPTANIKLVDSDKLLPGIGIYAALVQIDNKTLKGLLSIGKRPTFYDNGEIVPEVYIYDFNENIYNKLLTIEIIKKIRSEEKFTSAEELITQMNKDKEAGIKIFDQINNPKYINTFRNLKIN